LHALSSFFLVVLVFVDEDNAWTAVQSNRRMHTVELSRVGGVNAPVGSRDPVYNKFAVLLSY